MISDKRNKFDTSCQEFQVAVDMFDIFQHHNLSLTLNKFFTIQNINHALVPISGYCKENKLYTLSVLFFAVSIHPHLS